MTSIRSHAGIYKNTVKFISNELGSAYFVTFKFYSTYDCQITLYLCAIENPRPSNSSDIAFVLSSPLSIHVNEGFPDPMSFTFGPGKEQSFPNHVCQFQLDNYKKSLTMPTGNYFPLVIRTVTQSLTLGCHYTSRSIYPLIHYYQLLLFPCHFFRLRSQIDNTKDSDRRNGVWDKGFVWNGINGLFKWVYSMLNRS